jgi:DNA replication protein DnaC
MNNAAASLPLMLKHLRLSVVRTHWATVAEKALNEHWSPSQYLAELCHMELANREDKRLNRYLKESTLPSGKQLGNFDFDAVEGVSQPQIKALIESPAWVKTGDNLLLFGASGIGKTHLASSIGYGLVEAGIRVKFSPASSLVQHLQKAKQGFRLEDALLKFDKYAALILDDIGYIRKTDQETSVLFELIAHRYERNSLVITANQSFEDWDELFDDTVMTVAAIDRLVHHAKILQCKGESYRRKTMLKTRD